MRISRGLFRTWRGEQTRAGVGRWADSEICCCDPPFRRTTQSTALTTTAASAVARALQLVRLDLAEIPDAATLIPLRAESGSGGRPLAEATALQTSRLPNNTASCCRSAAQHKAKARTDISYHLSNLISFPSLLPQFPLLSGIAPSAPSAASASLPTPPNFYFESSLCKGVKRKSPLGPLPI